MILSPRSVTSILLASLPVMAMATDFESRIFRAVAPYVAAGDFAGTIAVRRGEQTSLIIPFGSASPQLGRPHRLDGVFMIGSVSKQFTAAAILALADDGQLATTDLVGAHLPDFAHGQRVTIHQLLNHTAGIEDVYSLKRFGRSGGLAGAFADVVADLSQTPLTHEPGSSFRYSNGGYSVLAAIIEAVSGQSYGAFLQQRFFTPLAMTSTAHDEPGATRPDRVPGYQPWGENQVASAQKPAEAYLKGSGSLWSSGADLLIWSEALHGGRLLSAESTSALTTDHGQSYGYGISVFQRFDRPVFGHDGRVAGYASDLAHYPEDNVIIAVLSNIESVARDEIRHLVAAEVFDHEVRTRPPRVFGAPPPDLTRLIGNYRFGPGFVVAINEDRGQLLARANEGGYSQLVPLADGSWFSRMLYATVRFRTTPSEQIDALIWGAAEGAPVGLRE